MLEPINSLLLVEDDDNDLIITKRKISRSNIEIKEFLTARTVGESQKLLKDNVVNIVLLDLNLPDSSGVETVSKIRSVYEGIIIVLTSLDDEQVGIAAIREGADEYLIKNQLNERLLSDSIYHSIARRKRWNRIDSIKDTITNLQNMMVTK